METRIRPTKLCSNPHCGGTIYEVGYAVDADAKNPKPVWRCCNCLQETPRRSHRRRTNRARAFAEWGNLNVEWKATDEALRRLVDEGKCASGVLLVHTSTFNYHMRQLCEIEKPSNWDVRYHTAHAKEELEKAKQFVAGKESENGKA